MKLAERMKKYEYITRDHLMPRIPVIVRVDGKAFHTFTKNFDRPFDYRFMDTMATSVLEVFKEMQGCKMAYIQSDEASFVLTDYDQLDTQGWFDYNQQKIVSISASTMTAVFNYQLSKYTEEPTCARFDSRAFNVPEAEVANYFLWRAQDWHRNSVTMYAQASFSHKELHKKTISDMHDMLYTRGKNWATDIPLRARNGTFIYRDASGVIQTSSLIQPQYVAIDKLWEQARPREV